MESITRTEQFDPAIEPAPTDMGTTQVRPPSMVASIRERCSACGAALASDQRYCVECGQRRGPARVPLMDEPARRARGALAADHAPRRPGLTVNSTLIAIIATLVLAMGVGVLIGRSGNSTSAKSPPAQIVTVGGAAGATTSATPTQPASGAGATSTAKSGQAHIPSASGTSSLKSTLKSKKSTAPAPKIVKVGSPGHGPGYQHGHFTGNFFGE